MRLARVAYPLFMLVLTSALSAQTRTEAAITANDVKARVAFLASDALRGRDTPSAGLETAASYIAGEFRSFGLQPAGDSGTFVQRWNYGQRKLTAAGVKAELKSAGSSRALAYLQDFFLIPGQNETAAGKLFLAGTASAQPAALPPAARGQVVAYHIPGKQADDAWLGLVRAILPAAFSAQPAAIVLILDPAFPQEQIAYVASQASGETLPVPMIGISSAAAKDWAEASGAEITLSALPEQSNHRPPNVVALLPGSDPQLRDSYVVISAHMDHVGVGAPDARGDSIYNGADDNASGTTALLEVAQAFAALGQQPKRSILFVAVSGEEKGLFGSAWFVQNPPVPAAKMVANINMDMIGRNSPDTVVAIGQDYSSLGPLVQQVARSNADLRLTVAPDLWPQEQLFFRSDHFSFARANIPAIFFTAGLHDDYHKPSDEAATIDADKNARVARLVFLLAQAIAASAEAPTWTPAGLAAMKAISGN